LCFSKHAFTQNESERFQVQGNSLFDRRTKNLGKALLNRNTPKARSANNLAFRGTTKPGHSGDSQNAGLKKEEWLRGKCRPDEPAEGSGESLGGWVMGEAYLTGQEKGA